MKPVTCKVTGFFVWALRDTCETVTAGRVARPTIHELNGRGPLCRGRLLIGWVRRGDVAVAPKPPCANMGAFLFLDQ
jgi:hypothetical protein